ncbi:MAG: carboxylating nicotinate-nucleotide diphosphorylase [Gallionella sp.]
MLNADLTTFIQHNVAAALVEDLRDGDVTAQLLAPTLQATARLITRQAAVLCGKAWFDTCFQAMDPDCKIQWHVQEGDAMTPNQLLCEIKGNARALLTAERSALNFLQTLSGTATITRRYVEEVAGINVKIMDTRKTLPSLRMAQKYAVQVGGGHNQRIGLFDGILIKENHIAAAGGIPAVLSKAFAVARPDTSVQIEVESLDELQQALSAGAKLILLDNFDLDGLRAAVILTGGHAELEASGGITLDTMRDIALTGVDRISIGTLTKDLASVDFSLRIVC